MSKDRYERRHRKTVGHPEAIAMMANADFANNLSLAEAMGLEGDGAVYKLITTKGSKEVDGTLAVAVKAAVRMERELQPSFGVTIEDAEGNTVAEVRDGKVEKE